MPNEKKLFSNLSMEKPSSSNSEEWKRPNQVMQLHRLKLKKRALQARMNKTELKNIADSSYIRDFEQLIGDSIDLTIPKRKNPFLEKNENKKSRGTKILSPGSDKTGDTRLFELLQTSDFESKKAHVPNVPSSFTSELSYTAEQNKTGGTETDILKNYIPIDWTLNTKMRLMSPKPFAWNVKLKTSEEASGTTGFVRCLDIGAKKTTLDTSPNARFHRCCLVWQHPSLPWLDLFPRSAGRVSAATFGNPSMASNQQVKDSLFREWSDSFRSLFQLLRARQCPYFYVCTNTFTVLFRAAGICGLSEAHALLTPTTRGLRQTLQQEDIVFTMPLADSSKRRSSGTADTSCDSPSLNVTIVPKKEDNSTEDDEDEDGQEDEWLQSLGVEDAEIRKINHSQSRIAQEKDAEVDNAKDSLVFVQGIEAQALFNFLINCKSIIAPVGALAGVPPTLLAPVAFHGATLKPLKVRESVVAVGKEMFYSLELRGPLLPHMMPTLCHLMTSSDLQQFSVSCAHVKATTPFSLARRPEDANNEKKSVRVPPSIFGLENLSDCGFGTELLEHFCSADVGRIQVLESLKYCKAGYTWS